MLAAGFGFALGHPLVGHSGGDLFANLHRTLFLAIWILVPLSAADCISRERREGTLGLLFLTPLKPGDIVIAKGLAHGLRALTLLVAVLPVMAIPLLLGGISWQQAVVSALINFSAVCWALAAALVASASQRVGLRAAVTAVLLAVGALLVFVFTMGLTLTGGRRVADETWFQGLALAGVSPRHWVEMLARVPASEVVSGVGRCAVFSSSALAVAVWMAAKRIRATWREEAPPVWVQAWQRIFCTPVLWLSFFRWWMRRKLNRNPIGWLEQRTWTGRLVTWSWLAVVISVYSAALTDANFFRNFHAFQSFLGWLMVGSIAASAAGSFRRERESGVLELLLVTPMTTNQIIAGRLQGLWAQFLPSMALLLGVSFYLGTPFTRPNELESDFFLVLAFMIIPVIGLYFSVRCRNYIAAFLMTLICGLLLPRVGEWGLNWILWLYPVPWAVRETRLTACFIQLTLAAYFSFKLNRRLATRSFPLERTT